jgi:VWFA-related protein
MPHFELRPRRVAVPWVLVLALAAGAGRAQAPPAGTFGEKVEVSEALADVLVTDRDGNVVLGLGPSDFRVRVDGRPAEVTAATFYSNRRFLDSGVARQLGIDPAAVPDRRYFLLFFDDTRSESFDNPRLLARQIEAGRDTVAWLRRELQPTDRVAVLDFNAHLEVQEDFSNDLEALERAVERAARGERPPADWPSRRVAPGDTRLDLPNGPGKSLAERTPEIHKAITAAADAVRDLPGRKNLILFTTGFGDLDTFGQYRPDPRYDRAMIEALNSDNVAVYAVDLAPPATRHSLEGCFTHLATATGGQSFLDVVQFGIPLDRVAKETNGYYLVSARIPGGAGGYREVDVEAVNPEFRVRARRGFGFRPAAPAPR